MPKKNKKANPILIKLISELKKNANENDAQIWKEVALRLERPLRNWPIVNLDHINKYVNEKETAVIPGKVLSNGNLNKKISIAAWSFSDKSIQKIKNAGSKYLTIEDLLKINPKGKDIRLLG
jgi:large subunit ribosomal protein L18e